MKQYTRKQLKEYARLGLARDLTEVDPDTLPKWYEKIGVSRGIYGMNGGLIWDKVTGKNGAGKLSGVTARAIGTKFFTPWTIGAGRRWPLLK